MPETPGKRYFTRLSSDTGFKVDSLEKVYRLITILGRLQQIPELSGLALKGGTAIQGFEFGFKRLSVDIDLNYVGSVVKEVMMRERLEIGKALLLLFKDLGYMVDPPRETYALTQFDAHFVNRNGGNDHLKVEINFLERLPVVGVFNRHISHPFRDIDPFPVLTYRAEELFAGKIRALLTRGSARDVFDANMIYQKMNTIDQPLFRKTTLFYLAMQKDDPRLMTTRGIHKLTDRQVHDTLLPMLSRDEVVDVDAMKGNALVMAEDILKMTVEERAFFNTLYKERRVDPGLLFQGFVVSGSLEDHPSIAWQLHQLDVR